MRISQLAADRAEEKLKAKMDLDKGKSESLETEMARLYIVAKKPKEELVSMKTTLATTDSLRQKLGETLVTTKHQFFQMHQRFEEAERIWREEYTILADRLNEQQCILPYTLIYKLFTSQNFGDFINACAKAQIDGAVMETLEMVKEDCPNVNVAQSKYGYR